LHPIAVDERYQIGTLLRRVSFMSKGLDRWLSLYLTGRRWC